MKLGDLIAGAGFERSLSMPARHRAAGEAAAAGAVEVSDLAYRSEAVAPGALFFCIPGFRADGHDFAPDAVARGAVALVCERPLALGVPELVVESARAAMAPLAAAFFGRPAERLDLIGVTGTNGKTTTVFLARQILEAAGKKTGLLGTIHSVVGGKVEPVERTTPEAIDLQRALRRMLDRGDKAAVMEVSSHALALGRADAIDFDCAIFTNLTLDHLDFHDTLDAYYDAKRRLFRPPALTRTSVVNVDDEWGARLAAELAGHKDTSVVTFAIEREADYRAADVRWDARGSRFVCQGRGGDVEVSLPLPGLFNVYNALGAFAAARVLGVDAGVAGRALSGPTRVPGRFEPVDEGQDFTVLVDYAHTPDSLANVLRAARDLSDGRVVCVFGAGGDRDREKRPLMGEAARRLADHVIVTSDNPRSEEPGAIIAAIVEGAERGADAASPSLLEVEPDRRAAIGRALRVVRAGDVVVIAGKGHEQGQELAGGRKVPFDDRDVARSELRELKAARARPAA